MATETDIEWCDHTFSPWWGCVKVHEGCKNCYAETKDHRWSRKGTKGHWGPSNPRRMIIGEWGSPAKWNAAAKAAGRMATVFCASMCDLFEDFTGRVESQAGAEIEIPGGRMMELYGALGNKTGDRWFWSVPALRARVCDIIEETPWLTWLLLTKRPENVPTMVPPEWLAKWPHNVVTGTSPCNQKTAEACLPALLKVPGRRFLSCEPLIGAINLRRVKTGRSEWTNVLNGWFEGYDTIDGGAVVGKGPSVDWVIGGGESGPGFRDSDPAWQEALAAQCKAEGVPFLSKQDSSALPGRRGRLSDEVWSLKQFPESLHKAPADLVGV